MKAVISLLLLLILSAPLAAADAALYCFTADWCGYCQQMKPVIARLQKEGYTVHVVNKDQQPQMAQQMGVRGLPYFVMLSENRIVDSFEGKTSYDRLVQMIHAAKPTQTPPQNIAQHSAPPLNRSVGIARGQSPQNPAAMSPAGNVQPAVYGQSAPSPSMADPKAQAMQAAVKLKVSDPDGHSYGSGTVIHTQQGDALVLTCAHLFRDSEGKGDIEVITFQDSPQGTQVPGNLLVYDLDRDVALVSIRTNTPIQPMPLGKPNFPLEIGQSAFSVGCDNGGPRNLYETRINSLNRYIGHDNVQAAGAPTVGRSGGGLFSPDGHLVGVCNAADDQDNEGIYAALPTIHAVIQQAKLAHLFQDQGPNRMASQTQLASHSQPADRPSPTPPRNIPPAPQNQWNNTPVQQVAQTASANTRPQTKTMDELSEVERQMLNYMRKQRGGAEVTVVLRSKANPTAQPAVFTLPEQPSSAFMQQASQSLPGRTPIVRGQSR